MMPLIALLVSLESSQWGRVHQVGFIMFWPTMEKLLNFEIKNKKWKIIKIKSKIIK